MDDLVVPLAPRGGGKHNLPDPLSIQAASRGENRIPEQRRHLGLNLRLEEQRVPDPVRPDRHRAELAQNLHREALPAPNGPREAD
ncbi:MAG: hypothetical protein GHCLOJNM_03945 [bacterium]|nr:hypothetical protein [bacterium]